MAQKEISSDLVGMEFEPSEVSWKADNTMLYALAVGAKPDKELDFVYENKGPKVLPTFGVIPGMSLLTDLVMNVKVNLAMVLHGEQTITLHRAIPAEAKGTTSAKIVEVLDKGKGAVLGVEGTVSDDNGPIFTNKSTLFIRGAGGFGGDRGPSTKGVNQPPEREPDHVVEDVTIEQQAAFYRLCGDRNPIHIDPQFAQMGGFDKPFLHGLCTYGFGGRAILHSLCGSDPEKFKSFYGRFSDQVWMGDTLITKIWVEGDGEALVQMETQKGNVVLSQAKATFTP
jgi:acyl dehydratase